MFERRADTCRRARHYTEDGRDVCWVCSRPVVQHANGVWVHTGETFVRLHPLSEDARAFDRTLAVITAAIADFPRPLDADEAARVATEALVRDGLLRRHRKPDKRYKDQDMPESPPDPRVPADA